MQTRHGGDRQGFYRDGRKTMVVKKPNNEGAEKPHVLSLLLSL